MSTTSAENKRILVADASREDRDKLSFLLNMGGYFDIIYADSTAETFKLLGLEDTGNAGDGFDLVLMDVFMADSEGILSLKKVKSLESMKDVPVIIITENSSLEDMLSVFEIGATDYIIKPVDNRIELIARINSAVSLKKEMDIRKARERELLEITKLLKESNIKLEKIASTDSLTNVANRRYFQEYAEREWRRAQRSSIPISIFMMDIDFFKLYNDRYGHQQGDDCLRRFASAIKDTFKRPADLPARYGGEEFIAILPETNINGALIVALGLLKSVEALNIPHEKSKVMNKVTFSMGIASMVPGLDSNIEKLIARADRALYKAKEEGRNRFMIYSEDME